MFERLDFLRFASFRQFRTKLIGERSLSDSIPEWQVPETRGTRMVDPELNIEHFRELLTRRHAELIELSARSVEEASTVEADQQRLGRLSRADALQNQALSQETLRLRHEELARVSGALARIEEGEYGYCLRCGKSVAQGRLEVDPSATLCIDCANRAES